MAGYYALMTHIDHQIGRFGEAVGEDGSAADTAWLFAADHGEMMGDHNCFRKALPYEGSARVPFVLRAPGRFDLAAGSEPAAPVELRDIMPTLLDVAGVKIPASVEGESVLPLARGASAEWREHIHGEHAWGALSNHFVTDGREKYIWFSQDGREQLFDLLADPQELHNLSADRARAPRLEHWRGVLARELAGREEGYSDGGRLIAGRPATAVLERVRHSKIR